MWLAAHLLSLAHGLAAALISLSAFYLTGLIVLPRQAPSSTRWPDRIVFGLAFYVLLCWVATSTRNISVIYVTVLFGTAVLCLAALRFETVKDALGRPHNGRAAARWVARFSLLYVFTYLLVRPAAGAGLLSLPSDGAIDLVTYARHAKHVLAFGTAEIDFGSVDRLHSPASAYLLAGHSLLFRGDPLDAAMPLLLMLAALFGAFAGELARSVFGLSWRVALTIAALAVCAPMFRWALTTYSLGELLSATSVLYLMGNLGRAAKIRAAHRVQAFTFAAGSTLLCFAAWSAGSLRIVPRPGVEAARDFPPLALLGLPSGLPSAATAPDGLNAAAVVILPFVPVIWAAVIWAVRRPPASGGFGTPAIDRRLVNALIVYIAAGLVVGNVAVQAVHGRSPVQRARAWRGLRDIGQMPFRTLTLKVADEPNGLSTALAMYYMPGKDAHVIGRGVSLGDLPFENVSRQRPMFIQGFGCEGVGHGDTVSAPGVGCLLMAPPGMTIETSYPFNRTFLFIDFDRMTSREPGGRWNTQPTLALRLTADPQRAPVNRDLYINFLVNPFLPPGVKPLQLGLRWGKGRNGAVLVGERQWFSLPVGSSDWIGNRLWTAQVTIEFPEGRTILFHEVALTEAPRGTVADVVSTRP